MRRKIQLIAGVLLALAGVLRVQAAQRDMQGNLAAVQEMQFMTTDAMNGVHLVVRVYPDIENDSDRFVLVRVPIRGREITFSDVEAAYPSITDSAYVLIQAADQNNASIAAMMEQGVYLRKYVPQGRRSIWSMDTRGISRKPWTLFDALGNPMAGAKVDVLLQPMENNATASIHLDAGTSNDEGQLASFYTYLGEITLRVEHPDYGVATVRSLPYGDAEREGIYVVPLAPRDIDTSSSSISGAVVDSSGYPVANLPVGLGPTYMSDDGNDCYNRLFDSRVFTDERGRFTLCVPRLSKDMVLYGLPDPGASYAVRIEPPESSYLRSLSETVFAGAPATLTLTIMDAHETFHTFSFEYADGPVTATDDLANMTLALKRDGRQWRTLTYDQFAGGCTLPTGTLSAETTRWGEPFGFASIELKSDSPEHLVFVPSPPIAYRGRVVEFGTNRPLPGVFILANHSLQHTDPSKLTAAQWDLLAVQAEVDATSEQMLYQQRDRVAVTDQDGCFELTFAPMSRDFGSYTTRLYSFTAFAPGYAAPPAAQPRTTEPNSQIMTIPTLELCRSGEVYFPQLIFEGENGPVTDPNRLEKISLIIGGSNWDHNTTVDLFQKDRRFIAGRYQAEVTWDDTRYVFGTVDLTTARPDVVVFKPASIEPLNSDAEITYRGLVVDATTGKPIGGAIVLCCGGPSPPGVNGLGPEEWAAIEVLGPNPDPSNPAFARFWASSPVGRRSDLPSITITNNEGWFELTTTKHSRRQRATMLHVLAQDYLASRETLAEISGGRPGQGPRNTLQVYYRPDEDGVAILPTSSLIPAATLIIHPVVQDLGYEGNVPEPTLRWSAPPDEPAAEWANALRGHRSGIPLEPNVEQVVLVPAEVALRLTMEAPRTKEFAKLSLGRIQLEKGQIHDLGQVAFNTGIEVAVNVVDPSGEPLEGARVLCMDEEMGTYFSSGTTDEYGVVIVKSPFDTIGYIQAYIDDPATGQRISGTVPYQIGGKEEAGKEFVVPLTEVVAGP